ncbi:MAG: hypothetical protein HY094_03540 [Candidatus Melainabacteria bacterium]|nr:hypothetical protein [Candidatus Melainabacteria bacterium]
MPVNPNNPLSNAARALAAQQVRNIKQQEKTKRAETHPQTTEEKDAETQVTRQAPPTPTPTRTTTADIIIRVINAARSLIGDTARLIFEAGFEASTNQQVNLAPKQVQILSQAATSSTRAHREGSITGAAAQIATNIRNRYSRNKNFDPDTVDVAARIIEAFIGGNV